MIVQIKAYQDEDGAWCATGVDHGIHTQGRTVDELFANIDEATRLHFEEDLEAGWTINVQVLARTRIAAGVGSRAKSYLRDGPVAQNQPPLAQRTSMHAKLRAPIRLSLPNGPRCCAEP